MAEELPIRSPGEPAAVLVKAADPQDHVEGGADAPVALVTSANTSGKEELAGGSPAEPAAVFVKPADPQDHVEGGADAPVALVTSANTSGKEELAGGSPAEAATGALITPEEFKRWLKSKPWPMQPTDEYKQFLRSMATEGSISLAMVSFSPRIEVGWREVTTVTVLSKAFQFLETKEWGPTIMLRDAGDGVLHFVTGHQRCCSMHHLMHFLWDMNREVPQFLKVMCGSLPAEVTSMTSLEGCFRGLKQSARVSALQTWWTPYSLLRLASLHHLDMEEVKKNVARELPELVNTSLFPWQVLNKISGRVCELALDRIEDFNARCFQTPVFPVAWFKESQFKLRGARDCASGEYATPEAQELWVARLVHEIEAQITTKLEIRALEEADQHQIRSLAAGLTKEFTSAKRSHFLKLAGLFAECLHRKFDWDAQEREELFRAFAEGTMDQAVLMKPSGPAFWPIVKTLQKRRKQDLAVKKAEELRNQLQKERATACLQAESVTASLNETLVSQRRLWMSTAEAACTTTKDEMDSLISQVQERLANLVDENEHVLAEAMDSRYLMLQTPRGFETWPARLRFQEYEKLVLVVDTNQLLDKDSDSQPLPRIVERALQLPQSLTILLLPLSGGRVHAWESPLLRQVHQAGVFHRRICVSPKNRAETGEILQMIVCFSDEMWDDQLAQIDVHIAAPWTNSRTLRGANRHLCGPPTRSWGAEFWSFVLPKIFRDPWGSNLTFMELEVGGGHLLETLLEHASGPKWVGMTWLGFAPARDDAIAQCIKAKFEQSRKEVEPSEDHEILEVLDKIRALLPPVPADCPMVLQVRQHANETQWQHMGLLTTPDGMIAECKASRKTLNRQVQPKDHATLKLPRELFQAREVLEDDLWLFPSTISQGMAVWPGRDFRKEEVVFRIGGSKHGEWGSYSSFVAVPSGLSVCMHRTGVKSTHLVLKFHHTAAQLLHVQSQVPDDKKGAITVLKADWVFSSTENPELLLRTTEHIKAFQSELAVDLVPVADAGKADTARDQRQQGGPAVQEAAVNRSCPDVAANELAADGDDVTAPALSDIYETKSATLSERQLLSEELELQMMEIEHAAEGEVQEPGSPAAKKQKTENKDHSSPKPEKAEEPKDEDMARRQEDNADEDGDGEEEDSTQAHFSFFLDGKAFCAKRLGRKMIMRRNLHICEMPGGKNVSGAPAGGLSRKFTTAKNTKVVVRADDALGPLTTVGALDTSWKASPLWWVPTDEHLPSLAAYQEGDSNLGFAFVVKKVDSEQHQVCGGLIYLAKKMRFEKDVGEIRFDGGGHGEDSNATKAAAKAKATPKGKSKSGKAKRKAAAGKAKAGKAK